MIGTLFKERQAEERGLRKLTYLMNVFKKRDEVADCIDWAKRESEKFRKRR